MSKISNRGLKIGEFFHKLYLNKADFLKITAKTVLQIAKGYRENAFKCARTQGMLNTQVLPKKSSGRCASSNEAITRDTSEKDICPIVEQRLKLGGLACSRRILLNWFSQNTHYS